MNTALLPHQQAVYSGNNILIKLRVQQRFNYRSCGQIFLLLRKKAQSSWAFVQLVP